MPQHEIPTRAERKRRYCRLGTKEALVVAVVRYAVFAVGVVVHQAEVVFMARARLGQLPQCLQTCGQWARRTCVCFLRQGLLCLCIEEDGWVRRREECRFIEPENGGESGGVYDCFDGAALDGVDDAVEGEGGAEEFEEGGGRRGWDVGVEVEEVEVGRVGYVAAGGVGTEGEKVAEFGRESTDGEGVGWMHGG